ncbi:MAG: hypothetical protein GY859_12930 [Desulfobacterales bacterium]|nr:hypothetical protein [Desulfobacterales bacterium]
MANQKGITDPADKRNASAGEENDEEIIDLTEIVESPEEEEDDVIELTEIVKESDEDAPAAAGGSVALEELEPDADISKDFIAPGEAGREEGREAGRDEAVFASREQIDAAVEKVVRDIYAEKIEAMLFEVINTVVKDEIGRLKGILEHGVQSED